MDVVEALTPPSPAPTRAAEHGTLVVGAVQTRWRADPEEHAAAAHRGAQVVFSSEPTLSRYPAGTLPTGRPPDAAEPLVGGPSHAFAAVLVAASDLDARRDWPLFPFLRTRRPDTSDVLTRPVASE